MKIITEEMQVHNQWYKEAGEMTMEQLPAFLDKLTKEYEHDYGTICHAIASAAIAAAWAVERTPQGGITGFQAGAVMWEFIRNWMRMYDKNPLRLVDYGHLLYPQYEHSFRTITQETWDWVQKEAKEKLLHGTKDLAGNMVETSPKVVAHWRSIAEGTVPFGLQVGEKE